MIKTKKNLIIGIDPGLNKTGWGVIDFHKGKDTCIENGFISTNFKKPLSERLTIIYSSLEQILDEFKPNYAAVEKIFMNTNPESTLKLGQARGVIFLALSLRKIPIGEYSPNQIKKTLVGFGHASKNQMMKMLNQLLPDIKIENEDAGDAIAIALCHSKYILNSAKNKNDC